MRSGRSSYSALALLVVLALFVLEIGPSAEAERGSPLARLLDSVPEKIEAETDPDLSEGDSFELDESGESESLPRVFSVIGGGDLRSTMLADSVDALMELVEQAGVDFGADLEREAQLRESTRMAISESASEMSTHSPASSTSTTTSTTSSTTTTMPSTTTTTQPAPPEEEWLVEASVWDRLAVCESGGNWSINTGNGYYGGLQFSLSTWNHYGGAAYAEFPHLATREQQIAVGEALVAANGGSFGAWSTCQSTLGLP